MSKNYNQTLQTNNSSLEEIITQLNNMPDAGGTDTSDATATASDLLGGKTAYANGVKITGTIPNKTAANLTASGSVVTVPSGYYASQVTKSIASGTQATPAITINQATGLITATATQTAGYIPTGTKSSTYQLAFQAAKTITPNTTTQTAVSSGYYTGGAITVAPIPNTYVKYSYSRGASTYTPKTTNQTISAGTYLTGAQTIKGDSNLVAGNIKSGVSIFGVTGNYVGSGSSGGGDTSMEDTLVTRTLTSYTNDRVTSIGSYAFTSCSSLTTVNFPVCQRIGSYAFGGCTSLTTLSFPKCLYISSFAFASCTNLRSINFPQCKKIDHHAFYCCYSLTDISFPLCQSISSGAFMNCSSLEQAIFPACLVIGSSAFESCTKLSLVSLPACRSIYRRAFDYCSSLMNIYLLGSSICNLINSNAFSHGGITSSTGAIYVPTSLVASYKAATNWTYFSNIIYGMTGGGGAH